jgi:ribonuclease BN (tRNA processing enzyme)
MNRLTVLGCRAGSPRSGCATSGYLLEIERRRILLDCGPGVATALSAVMEPSELDAIIVSHRHADHCADLVALAYHQTFPTLRRPIPLFAPTGFTDLFDRLDDVWGIPSLSLMRTPLTSAFDVTEIEPGTPFTAAGVAVATVAGEHPVPVLATRFPAADLAFTGDTGWSESLPDWACDVGTLLCEATYPDGSEIELARHGHLTGSLAGRLARRASAGHLVLTHFAELDEVDLIRSQAASEFDGRLSVANPGARFDLG